LGRRQVTGLRGVVHKDRLVDLDGPVQAIPGPGDLEDPTRQSHVSGKGTSGVHHEELAAFDPFEVADPGGGAGCVVRCRHPSREDGIVEQVEGHLWEIGADPGLARRVQERIEIHTHHPVTDDRIGGRVLQPGLTRLDKEPGWCSRIH